MENLGGQGCRARGVREGKESPAENTHDGIVLPISMSLHTIAPSCYCFC